VIARNQHFLSGLLRCGACNGHMIITKLTKGKHYVACSAAYRGAGCSHRRSYTMDGLKNLVLDGMRDRLIDPKAITEAAKAYHAEYEAQAKKDGTERNRVESQLNRLAAQIDRITDAIADSDEPLPALLEKLKAKEIERGQAAERLRQLKAVGNIVTLHPKVIKDYQANIEKLHEALTRNPGNQEVRLAFRNMVDSVIVHEIDYGAPYEISVFGRLSAITGIDVFPTAHTSGDTDNPD
jgi:site-specific DNA recombinase